MCKIRTKLDVDGEVRRYKGNTFVGANMEGDNIDSMIFGKQDKICQTILVLFLEILDRVDDAAEFAMVMTALSVMKERYGETLSKWRLT